MLNQCPSTRSHRSPVLRAMPPLDAPAWQPPRFLTEPEAAAYLGLSLASLAELRLRDLAMIARGHSPLGPPALWQGMRWSYATETLDEWRSRNAGGRRTGALATPSVIERWDFRR